MKCLYKKQGFSIFTTETLSHGDLKKFLSVSVSQWFDLSLFGFGLSELGIDMVK